MSDLQRQQIEALVQREFPDQLAEICQMMSDVEALYDGRWDGWQPCQVPYHTIEHVLAVVLVSLRILAGYGRCHQQPLDDEVRVLVAAALFHDSGYVKRDHETAGRGGQFTFEHVQRSQQLAAYYLEHRQEWPCAHRQAVVILIGATEIIASQQSAAALSPQFEVVSRILASGDLLAQVADVHYIEKLPQLFAEFEEAYELCGRQELAARGIHVFSDLEALLAGSARFIRQQVLPRLAALGDMERYLQVYYAQPQSPYRQQLLKNLHYFESVEI